MIKEILLVLATFWINIITCEKIRGCYYTNWAQYRSEPWKYFPENYPKGLCTHLFYAFAILNPDFTIKPFEWNDIKDWSKPDSMYTKATNLKNSQKGLKVLLSFGGWTFSQETGPALIRQMVSSSANRKIFIDSVKKLLIDFNFDGFDLDWEYPDTDKDKKNFVSLIKEFRKAFGKKFLLTAAVSANPKAVDKGYDGPALAKYLDFINIMTYDFHGGSWETVIGLNSPLTDMKGDKFSIVDATEKWLSVGVPKEKLIIGIATYGRGYKVGSDKKLGGTAVGASAQQQYTKADGMIAYYEVCLLRKEGGWKVKHDKKRMSKYMYKGDQWFSFDDATTVKEKVLWIKEKGFGGAFVWDLDFDDFLGKCTGKSLKKYPLISQIKKYID